MTPDLNEFAKGFCQEFEKLSAHIQTPGMGEFPSMGLAQTASARAVQSENWLGNKLKTHVGRIINPTIQGAGVSAGQGAVQGASQQIGTEIENLPGRVLNWVKQNKGKALLGAGATALGAYGLMGGFSGGGGGGGNVTNNYYGDDSAQGPTMNPSRKQSFFNKG